MEYTRPNITHNCSMNVLQFLNGTKYDTISFNYIFALKPCEVIERLPGIGRTFKVLKKGTVEVYLDENRIIQKITQEVEKGFSENDFFDIS